MCAVLQGVPERCEALVQNYVAGFHWRSVILSFGEAVGYYVEPYGDGLSEGSPIRATFAATLGAIQPKGWRLIVLNVALQPRCDQTSCGVWILVINRAFVAYCNSLEFGRGTFATFLPRWLSRLGRKAIDLSTVRGRGDRRAAVEGNLAFIAEERRLLRERLVQAASNGFPPAAR